MLPVSRRFLQMMLLTLTLSTANAYTLEVYGYPADDPGCALHWAVFTPDTGTWGGGPYPVCLLIHGGEFQRGTPTDNSELDQAALDMTDAGYLALSIEYRLAGSHPLPG
jgi:acetyl esterase/lipase